MPKRPPAVQRRRIGQGLLAIVAVAALACSTDNASSPTPARPAVAEVAEMTFRFDPSSHPTLEVLARQEHLTDLIDPEASSLDQIVRIRDWAAGQWPAGTPNPYPPWDALVILDWIRSGTTGGFCAQYSQLFLQSLAALGFAGRYVEIGSVDNPYAHYVTEAWVPDLQKWVLMDADYNLHFERDGTPMSALEIHDALLDGSADRLAVVRGTIREGHSNPDQWALKTAELYYYVRFHLKANHLSAPDENPFDRYGDMVEWLDDRVVPWHESSVLSIYPKERLTERGVRERSLVESPPAS